jgi:signal transduction histidine kinase
MRERLSMERQLRETQTQLLQAEKMSSLGKLAAGIAHQINNPLAGIMLAGHLLQERHGVDPDAREELESIIENANRCREIVKDLLGFARQTRRQVAPMDLNRALERTLFLLVNQPLFHNIRIERRLQPDLPALQADEQQLNQVFMNLILNAAEAMGGRGTLAVRTRRADEDLVEFEIEDTGCGIRPEVLSHIFEPFFTTKPPGKGTGLGLSVAYGIVAQHGGAIDVRSREGLGTTFCVRLPLRPGVTEEPPP